MKEVLCHGLAIDPNEDFALHLIHAIRDRMLATDLHGGVLLLEYEFWFGIDLRRQQGSFSCEDSDYDGNVLKRIFGRDIIVVVVAIFKDLILKGLSFSQLDTILPRVYSYDPLGLLLVRMQQYLQSAKVLVVGAVMIWLWTLWEFYPLENFIDWVIVDDLPSQCIGVVDECWVVEVIGTHQTLFAVALTADPAIVHHAPLHHFDLNSKLECVVGWCPFSRNILKIMEIVLHSFRLSHSQVAEALPHRDKGVACDCGSHLEGHLMVEGL